MTTKDYKSVFTSFNTADFGEYNAREFIEGNIYRKPTVYPSGSHPSIYFTENTIDKVRENLSSEECKEAYKRYIALSETVWDGDFGLPPEGIKHNYDGNKIGILEAKAFRYAMTKEEKYGYEAVSAAKKAILTINVPRVVGDSCRTYGHLMYGVACVYDWCYDLLTEEDKKYIIAGCVNRLGPEFEMCRYLYNGNKLPIEQGVMYGHGAEDQLLVDYLAFAIASYTEAPEIYELVAGRVLNDYVEGQNFLFNSGSPWEGTMYGSVRLVATLTANILISKMTEDRFIPFTSKLEDAVITTVKYIRPDGHIYRIGDTNENNTAFQFVWMKENCLFAGNFYKNAYLKSVAYDYLEGFSQFWYMVAGMSPIQFLALNDPKVPHTYDGEISLTHRTYCPNTNIFAKSSHEKDAFGIYMTMPEHCAISHAHLECGSFQIYYKGPLVSDSGAYYWWGDLHHFGYTTQTVSANSLLIYNPALRDIRYPSRENMLYSGGQSINKSRRAPYTLSKLIEHPALGRWCKPLGLKNCECDGEYFYSYMAGDMTGAYDDETVDDVCRYMLAFKTDDEKCPYAFMTYDRISAKEASFHKSALIHVQEEPKIEGDFAIITTTKRNTSGKMVVQTVGEETEYTVIGGEGKEFWIPGVDEDGNYSLEAGQNLEIKTKKVEGSLEEFGWGRIEISPKNHEKTNNLLTVMYVTDQSNTDEPIKAENISSGGFAGAKIFGKQVYFPKTEKIFNKEASLEVKEDGECYITGLMWDEWTIFKDGEKMQVLNILTDENMLKINLKKGNYTFKRTIRD